MTLFGANPVDVVVLIMLLVSALLALARGFVAEVMAIVGWVAAAFAALYGLDYVLPHMEPYLGKGMISVAASSGVLFFGTLAAVSAVGYILSRQLRGTHLSAIDRSLGFLFGLLRGSFLVCLLFICVTFVFPPPKDGVPPQSNTMQAVLAEARTAPALAYGAQLIASFAPNKSLSLDDLTKLSPLEKLMQPQVEKGPAKEGEAAKGYTPPAQNQLNQMLDVLSGDNNDAAPAATPAEGAAEKKPAGQ